ncbi:ArsR/SmtB family transcription factor [Tumebacillus permanentifrigoris]|uniref:ArsR family transcriptional regulator n=1 Tax=Tumebacillus permanentifrigoris TaxID=378543 RepID=A0A316D4Q7_9BACL|nr:metalloregulator ArsR/SmtB family transcription factor [Tumebacillus permanentifrigoris]PWK07453.1 ArsR family transcriptional regulator [Tumebacillus permanentifrigoris]
MQPLETTDSCCNVIHEDTVTQVREAAMDEQAVTDLAAIFAALGDPTRVRIIRALSVSEMCVCDLAAALEMTQSAVSHQLRLLRNMRIIKRRKSGRMNYYSLDDEHILTLFETGLHHVTHR